MKLPRHTFCFTKHLAGTTVLGWMLSAIIAAAKPVGIETAVEPTEVYQGEAVTLTIRVSGFQEGMEPDLRQVPATGISLLGQSDQNFQNVTIVNGRRQVSSFSGRIFQYRVIPDKAGGGRLGPVNVTEAGRTIATAPGPAINVRPVPRQDHVLLFIEASKPQVILEESFTVTLRILVRRLQPPYAEESPLPANAPPFLSIPWLDRGEMDGLERENIEQRLNAMLVSAGESFRINNFSVGNDPFGGIFGQQQQARFRLDRLPVTHGGNPYFEYSIALRFTPQREGIYRFGPVVSKGPVFVQVTPQGEGLTETIYAIAEAVAVRATPPPEEGRPPTYIGAIGSNVTVSAALDSQTCYVGDPLTLTLDISGDLRLENVTAPRLGVQKSLLRDFRIYEDTVQRESTPDRRRYRFTIRPAKAGTLEFPPVAVSYYDTARSAYGTVFTEPIPVRANAVTEVRGDIIIGAGAQSMTIIAGDESEIARMSPAPLQMNGNRMAAETFFIPRLHLPLLAAGPLLYLAVELLRLLRHLRPRLHRLRARRSAAAIAQHRIRQAGSSPLAPSVDGPPDLQVSQALREYLQTRCGGRVKSATPGECGRLLQEAGIPAELALRFTRCLEDCTNAAFAGQASAGSAPQARERRHVAESLIQALENAWPRKRHSPPGQSASGITGLLLLLAVVTSPGRAGSLQSGTGFEAQRADAALLAADQPESFAEAADALAALVDQGAANSGIFFNYGTALLMAGDPAAALEALARAERYSGTSWSIRRNMLLAQRALQKDGPVTLPWTRIPLFWHFLLPAAHRITIAAAAFLLAWSAALLLRTRLREAAAAVLGLAVFLFLLFGASAFSSLYAEHHAALAHAQRLPHAANPGEDHP